MKCFIATMMIIGLVLAPVAAMAAGYTFDNDNADNDWNNAVNWNPDTSANLPNIHGPDDYTVDGANSTACAVFTEIGTAGSGTAYFTIDTSGTVSFTTPGNGPWYGRNVPTVVDHVSGTVNTESSCIGRGTAGTCTYNLSGGAWNLAGALTVGEQATGALLEQTGGAVSVGDNTSNDNLSIGMGVNYDGTYRISGGSLTVNATDLTANGGMNIGGWWYGGASPGNLYDGGPGLFEVVGTGPSSITVNGQLAVSGNSAGGGKGTLKFTMGAGGVTPMTVNGTVRATIAATWAGDARGDGDLVIDMTGLGGGVGDIPLILNDGVDAIVGSFAAPATNGAVYGSYALNYSGGDGNDLVLEGGTGGANPGTLIYGK